MVIRLRRVGHTSRTEGPAHRAWSEPKIDSDSVRDGLGLDPLAGCVAADCTCCAVLWTPRPLALCQRARFADYRAPGFEAGLCSSLTLLAAGSRSDREGHTAQGCFAAAHRNQRNCFDLLGVQIQYVPLQAQRRDIPRKPRIGPAVWHEFKGQGSRVLCQFGQGKVPPGIRGGEDQIVMKTRQRIVLGRFFNRRDC